jgi:hypothetical protein
MLCQVTFVFKVTDKFMIRNRHKFVFHFRNIGYEFINCSYTYVVVHRTSCLELNDEGVIT